MQLKTRTTIAALTLSATALIALVSHEDYRDSAHIPVAGDVPTIGFGTTDGVKMGDKIDPVAALKKVSRDLTKFEGSLKKCVKVPLYQNEYDAFISLSYNIGSGAFCGSRLVKKLNAGDYAGACESIKDWSMFKGKRLQGLVNRRAEEYKLCMGNT